MLGNENAKEYAELVYGFLKKNPRLDREAELKEMTVSWLKDFPQYVECLGLIDYISRKANFMKVALLFEMRRKNLKYVSNVSTDFEISWHAAVRLTESDMSLYKTTSSRAYRSAEELEKALLKRADLQIRSFVGLRFRTMDGKKVDSEEWINMVSSVYEENMIFGKF